MYIGFCCQSPFFVCGDIFSINTHSFSPFTGKNYCLCFLHIVFLAPFLWAFGWYTAFRFLLTTFTLSHIWAFLTPILSSFSTFLTERMSLQLRECKLSRKEGEKYGFCLRVEKFKAGHIIRKVEKDSPAEKAGLKDGDRVLWVNGIFVDKEDHGEVWPCKGTVLGIAKENGQSRYITLLDLMLTLIMQSFFLSQMFGVSCIDNHPSMGPSGCIYVTMTHPPHSSLANLVWWSWERNPTDLEGMKLGEAGSQKLKTSHKMHSKTNSHCFSHAEL